MKVRLVGTLVFVLHGLGAVALAQEEFTADALLERSIVDEAGRTISVSAPTRFRLVESIRSGQPVTRLTYFTPPGLPTTGAATDPLAGMSVELDDDGRQLRVVDRYGRELGLQKPGAATAGRARPSRSAHGGPIFRNAHAAERLTELQADLGMPRGKVRELDRYVRQTVHDTTEVLVLMPWAVTVEVNVVRDGAMETHATYEYDQLPDGSLLQRVARTESRLPDRPQARAVVQLTFSNVVMAKGR